MGTRTSYAPGTFCWVELQTSDMEGARAFYHGLFGWDFETRPVPGAGEYTMMCLDDGTVAGGASLMPDQVEMGVPPNWFSYVSVEDADAAAERVTGAGGRVLAGPFDVMTAGRMAVVADPQGAVFGLWQPGDTIGATLVNDPGCLTLNQLNTSDVAGATAFYTRVFGWDVRQMAETPPYWGLFVGEAVNGGMMPLDPSMQAPPHWLAYFTTADMQEAVRRIGELGGRVMLPPTPVGPEQLILVARDPQGAYFALYEGRVDP